MDFKWPTDTGFEFYILALIIVLSLIAAVGAWRRPRSLTRDEAEDMFASQHERNSGETQRLRDTIAELQRASGSQLQAFRTDTQEQLTQTRQLVEQTLATLQPALESKLGDLTSNVTQALSEARRSQDAGIEKVEGTLQQVRAEVDRASTEVKTSIVELQRQHNEAKAQSAIQLCEALISSLGTLRNTIAAQIADSRTAEMLLPNEELSASQQDLGPDSTPESPRDMDSISPDDQVSPS